MSIKAEDVLAALESRHSGDIFIPECNLGSAMKGCRRIDAWAMRKSWSPLTTVGYEIKVSRSDFLNDEKWRDYIGFCHELWFACPWKLIAPEELPDGIGLLWMNKGGTMVRKRKAVRAVADSQKLMDAMAYILMSRTKVVDRSETETVSIDYWKDWLASKQEHHLIGRKVQQAINKRCADVQEENFDLKYQVKRFDKMRERLLELGLDPDETRPWELGSKINQLRGVIDRSTLSRMQGVSDSLSSMVDELKAISGAGA